MPLKTEIPTTVVLKITIVNKPHNIITYALVDNGSQMTLINRALISWKVSPNKILVSGINGASTLVAECHENLEIIIGSKICHIPVVYPSMNDKYDVLLGNDFIQLFQSYSQTLYGIRLHTICGHYLKIPREYKPFRVQPAQRGGFAKNGYSLPKKWSELYESVNLTREQKQKIIYQVIGKVQNDIFSTNKLS